MKATLEKITWHTPNRLASFSFKPEGRFTFIPGQYIELHVAHDNPDNRGQSREFSIASLPQDAPLITIITTFPTEGQQQSTFKQALRSLQPGAYVDLAQARGDFVLPKDSSIPLVFIAGGIGIVPFMSIVGHLAKQESSAPIQLVHTVNSSQALLDDSLFVDSGVCQRYLPITTGGTESSFAGRITADEILQYTQPTPRTLFYISGPESMAQDLRQQLIAKNISTSVIVVDEFTRYDP